MVKINDINELIDLIKNFSLSIHKLTFRYGIDYIKCDISLKEKYPKIFEELHDYFIPRKVIFKYYSDYHNKNIIECGNEYELNTLIGIPKAILTPINENEILIEDLKWVPLENFTDKEITEYKNKLILLIEI